MTHTETIYAAVTFSALSLAAIAWARLTFPRATRNQRDAYDELRAREQVAAGVRP